MLSASNYGVEAINVAMRRRALVRLWMACTSWRTDLGQRWWGRVCPLPGVLAIRGNMVVAKSMASRMMFYRSAARESVDSRPPRCMPCASAVGLDVFRGSSRLVRMALAVAIAKEVGEWDSTATCVSMPLGCAVGWGI